MPKLKTIVVIHSTAKEPPEKAGSTAKFTLEIPRPEPAPDVSKPFPDKPREAGKTDIHPIDVSSSNVDSDDPGFSIKMKIQGADGWLPQSILVLGETTTGRIILLGYHPQWPFGWFDKASTEDPTTAGPEAHVISG